MKALILAAVLMASGPDGGPPDTLFEQLKSAETQAEAEGIAEDIVAGWLNSGSPTVDILMERGTKAQVAGDLDRAMAFYDRAILIAPGYAEAWNRRASIFMKQDRFDQALHDVNAALEREPRHFGAWLGLGLMLEELGARRQALEAYREALALHPHLTQARRAEARLAPLVEGTTL